MSTKPVRLEVCSDCRARLPESGLLWLDSTSLAAEFLERCEPCYTAFALALAEYAAGIPAFLYRDADG